MTVKIYHNPRCSKSRQTLELLNENGIEPEVIEYLKNPPTIDELEQILGYLEKEPFAVCRPKEDRFKELGLSDSSPRADLVRLMVENPVIIERPIVVNGDKAAVGRPPESVLEIL